MTTTAIMYNVQIVDSRHNVTLSTLDTRGAELNKADPLFLATTGARALIKRQGLNHPAQA